MRRWRSKLRSQSHRGIAPAARCAESRVSLWSRRMPTGGGQQRGCHVTLRSGIMPVSRCVGSTQGITLVAWCAGWRGREGVGSKGQRELGVQGLATSWRQEMRARVMGGWQYRWVFSRVNHMGGAIREMKTIMWVFQLQKRRRDVPRPDNILLHGPIISSLSE